jgi:aminopeptidase-like protein
VVIDAKIAPGAMTYGTSTAPGGTEEQVLVTTHLCHPAMWNDNATGLVAVAIIGSLLHTVELRRAHTLLFLPGTIGAITWLATHRDQVANIVGGLALTGLGDTAALNFKRSRRGGSLFDRAAEVTIGRSPGAKLHEFTPYGYDERQFCSPGFNLGFGRLNRGAHGEYPEYHTSLDNRDFVDAGRVADAVRATLELLDAVERNDRFINTEPYGEPQLGRRGLYSSIGTIDAAGVEMGYLWVLSMSDGTADLIEISRRSGLAFSSIAEAAQRLLDAGLLSRVSSR